MSGAGSHLNVRTKCVNDFVGILGQMPSTMMRVKRHEMVSEVDRRMVKEVVRMKVKHYSRELGVFNGKPVGKEEAGKMLEEEKLSEKKEEVRSVSNEKVKQAKPQVASESTESSDLTHRYIIVGLLVTVSWLLWEHCHKKQTSARKTPYFQEEERERMV